MRRPAVPPTEVSIACTPVAMRGPGNAPDSTTSLISGPIPITVSGSMNAVTPARSSLGRLNNVTIAAVVGGRWKNSSSFDCTSSKVMWQWASISPGMIVAPARRS
jgi:hypothetical protein